MATREPMELKGVKRIYNLTQVWARPGRSLSPNSMRSVLDRAGADPGCKNETGPPPAEIAAPSHPPISFPIPAHC